MRFQKYLCLDVIVLSTCNVRRGPLPPCWHSGSDKVGSGSGHLLSDSNGVLRVQNRAVIVVRPGFTLVLHFHMTGPFISISDRVSYSVFGEFLRCQLCHSHIHTSINIYICYVVCIYIYTCCMCININIYIYTCCMCIYIYIYIF